MTGEICASRPVSSGNRFEMARRHVHLCLGTALIGSFGSGCGGGATASSRQTSAAPPASFGGQAVIPITAVFDSIRTRSGSRWGRRGIRRPGCGKPWDGRAFWCGSRRPGGGRPSPGAGTASAYGDSRDGFVYNDDLQLPDPHHTWIRAARFRTPAQWSEATTMSVKMMEKLCRAASGKPCPI
jgi:hypothetical protein